MLKNATFSLVAAGALVAALPAEAAPLSVTSPAVTNNVEQVAWRGGRHWRGGHWRGAGWHHGRWGHRHRGIGPGIIGGVIAGALIAGAIREGRASDGDIAQCEEAYRSFDPASGTYLGYDGERHICPYLR